MAGCRHVKEDPPPKRRGLLDEIVSWEESYTMYIDTGS